MLHRKHSCRSPGHVASFHSTPSIRGFPMIPAFIGALKASSTLGLIRTVGQVALTFLPVVLFRNRIARKYTKYLASFRDSQIVSEEKKALLLRRIRWSRLLFRILVFVPVALFWIVILASAERTPITGRWRLILLSPDEEDDIAAQFAGIKWSLAVLNLLPSDGPRKLIPENDWRLENAIPALQREHEFGNKWLETTPDQPPFPPPADYPLRPRPRASAGVRKISETLRGRRSPSPAHVIAGPPYSLLIVDKPDATKAFSYGFGPDGASGIVIYSGFLDDILAKSSNDNTNLQRKPKVSSWWAQVFGSLFSASASNSAAYPTPTEDQTANLAILLAHEVAHLVLSHQLEALSSSAVVVPVLTSIFADTAHTLLEMLPTTMLSGPIIGDAIARLEKAGSAELSKLGEYRTSVSQEIEADIVSARLLAHAGFDARQTIAFWESRILTHRIAGISRPVNGVRIERLKDELMRWELEKRVALKRRQVGKLAERPITDLV
ncbi:hypothetical protein EDD16DRAFT_1696223 [Pisolithus croceorrhizus]|nr:hypothetical protein EDD16DRAFT_1696223 [Pisolithus croceorrhizus]KAI6115733.1 hypothetical protein EV401DRAFT_2058124 [Pisolithus croceorrhizus]